MGPTGKQYGSQCDAKRGECFGPKEGGIWSLTKGCVRYRKEAVWVLLGTQYGSQFDAKRGDCFGPKEGGIGSLTKGCVRYRKEAVWVLMGTQYGSQCESKRGDWVHDKVVCESKERGPMGPAGNAIWVPV